VALSPGVGPVIERLAGRRVLVIGDAMLDTYLRGTTERLCQEAPVPIVAVAERIDAPGGAANTAVNAKALGADVTLLAAVGDDAEGRTLRDALEDAGVGTDAVLLERGRRTLAKQRVLAGVQMLVRFDQGSTGPLVPVTEREIARRIDVLAAASDAILISDYGYGVLGPRVLEALAALQRRAPRVVVVDAKNLAAYRPVAPTAVKPNFREAARLLGALAGGDGERADRMAGRGGALLDLTGAQLVAVTLDADGALFFERGREPYRTYARPVDHGRAAGAGDTFSAALGLALAAGADLPAAAEMASAAAAVVVAKEGTATCSLAELRAYLAGGDKYAPGAATLAPTLEDYRRRGRRIVLTSGCFDLLHRGHIAYLNAAKSLGDVLILGLNSDASVRRLKGPERPINTLDDRAQVLAGLSCVDHIVAFDEDTPVDLVAAVRPQIFVKGGDYSADQLPEAAAVEAHGGVLRILPFVQDRSTTSIIERIRAAAGASGSVRASGGIGAGDSAGTSGGLGVGPAAAATVEPPRHTV
jgi:D-beta-D-heptose 7-phosphate kinase/D-beta-D-heptose 1-phosphate adenosyltransferase